MTQSSGKKSSRLQPARDGSAPLSENLLRRLNGYQLAAGAAGVAMLSCASPAEAAPICGTLSVAFSYTATYAFNPAHQKVAPFNVAQTYNELASIVLSRMERGFFTPNTPDAKEVLSANGFPANLASGESVGPGGQFGKGKSYGQLFGYYYFNKLSGNFKSGQAGYVGFEFSELGQTHYGWLRLRVATHGLYPSLLLSEFGYESTPNTAILAGNCAASANAMPASGLKPAGLAENQKSAAPASLDLLALGSEGLPVWRRKMLG